MMLSQILLQPNFKEKQVHFLLFTVCINMVIWLQSLNMERTGTWEDKVELKLQKLKLRGHFW